MHLLFCQYSVELYLSSTSKALNILLLIIWLLLTVAEIESVDKIILIKISLLVNKIKYNRNSYKKKKQIHYYSKRINIYKYV